MSSKTKILYVDDELINLKVFEINFNKKYEVFIAEHGVKGLELLKQHLDIKIVISDMRMPIMNGIEFIKKVKEIDPKIPCYILTGFDMNDEIEECIESGLILGHFTKPFSATEITASIENSIHY